MHEEIVLAGGCFWGVQKELAQLEGVLGTEAGFAGGTLANPDYQLVCSGRSGHAEAVRVVYDPQRLPLDRLLKEFLASHDPTSLNRQGPDTGSQYRSAIFCQTQQQLETSRRVLKEVGSSGRYRRPLVTEVSIDPVFWPAGPEHQRAALPPA